MKQISKTAEILSKLRAAYGVDAATDDLAVYEVVLANTQPLRKTGGLFKGARLSSTLLSDIVNAVNAESVPIQLQHNTSTLPYGRLFSAALVGDEARGLLAVDQKAHPDLVQKLDSGTLDQVSVGMVNKQLLCSSCGFDYMQATAYENRWDLTCNKEHKIGENGVHIQVVGLDSLFETSFVGQGAVRGARVIGPSESAFQANPRLAASSAATDGALAIHLTATVEDENMLTPEFLTQLTSATEARTRAETQLAAITTERDAATTSLTAVTGERDTAIANLATATTERDTAVASLATAQEAVTAAVAALSTEAKGVLIACGKNEAEADAAIKDKDAAALLAILTENRAKFAAIIPTGGAANAADTNTKLTARPTAGAFRSPTRP